MHIHINILKVRYKFRMKIYYNLSYTKKINFGQKSKFSIPIHNHKFVIFM
jgi:hypothetical protein